MAFPPPPPFADAGWTTPSAKMNVAMNANLKKAVMAGALRTLKRWGVKLVVQTNASGSLRGHMCPGNSLSSRP